MIQPIFFTIPKAFAGHIGDIQTNAIRSWLSLDAKPRVILFGDDKGVGEAAKELGVEWMPKVRRSEHGTPLLGDVFRQVADAGNPASLVYLNADIITPRKLLTVIGNLPFPRFMATGRRITLEIEGRLDLPEIHKVTEQPQERARLDPPHALDYFVLHGCLEAARIPDFAVGRPGWDNWMIYNVLRLGIPVVDLTRAVPVVHQHHDYRHVPAGRANSWEGPEADENRRLAGARERLRFSIGDATHLAHADGTYQPNRHSIARRLRLVIATYPARKWFLEILGFPFLLAERMHRRSAKKAARTKS